MSKIRIYTLAKDLNVDTHKMLEMLDSMGVEYKSISSTLDEETVQLIKELVAEQNKPVAATEVVAALPAKTLERRPPVITVMGHVDHGKTSLLDFIRKAKVAEREAGGITQHVGAFEAQTKKGKVVFIDTPGHEAFTSIRQRGAQVADIAIIVVAADDSIMPQTREAIAHARAAKVPMVVAINKIDLAGINLEKIKQDLVKENLIPEEFGGDTIVVPVSARHGTGVDDLLEYLALLAELDETMVADKDGDVKGVIIESKIDKQAGVLATILIQNGTLHITDFVVVGESYGKIKAMTDSNGKRLSEAVPGTAVQVLGFAEAPVAGELVARVKNEHQARAIVEGRKEIRREEEAAAEARVVAKVFSLETIFGDGSSKVQHELNIILRADTQGSLEAIQGILARASTAEVTVNVMFAGIGAPSEGDVLLASTAEAIIMCFSVVPAASVKKAADNKKIEIKTFRIIYELNDEVRRLVRGSLDPVFEERYLGKAEIRLIIPVPRINSKIAGSYVLDGKIQRNARARLLRAGKEIYKGSVSGLKRFKEDVREVAGGYECGINLSNFDDYAVGDVVEVFEMVEVKVAA
jgi:translation initiation factor IF-2